MQTQINELRFIWMARISKGEGAGLGQLGTPHTPRSGKGVMEVDWMDWRGCKDFRFSKPSWSCHIDFRLGKARPGLTPARQVGWRPDGIG